MNDDCNTFRTGIAYRGFYAYGQVEENSRKCTFSGGLLYDRTIKNTNLRLMTTLSKNGFYVCTCGMQDFHLPYVNLMPTALIDSKLMASLGVYLPINFGKHVTIGFWYTKTVKEAEKGGIRLGKNNLEIDLYFRF